MRVESLLAHFGLGRFLGALSQRSTARWQEFGRAGGLPFGVHEAGWAEQRPGGAGAMEAAFDQQLFGDWSALQPAPSDTQLERERKRAELQRIREVGGACVPGQLPMQQDAG